jgi:hypothetical protein
MAALVRPLLVRAHNPMRAIQATLLDPFEIAAPPVSGIHVSPLAFEVEATWNEVEVVWDADEPYPLLAESVTVNRWWRGRGWTNED